MEPLTLTYHLDAFEGPLDLLLTLVQKNKVDIANIPIALICDQYMAYIRDAQSMDMNIASEFLVMASELMLIKSKMLLPHVEPEEEDPRAALAEALWRYQQAKEGAVWLSARYTTYAGRMSKDTDEISIDKTFVEDQNILSLCKAVRRLISYREERPHAEKVTFTPMIATPIVPVETKIIGILRHFPTTASSPSEKTAPTVSLRTLLDDAVSLPDMIAIFLGVLELMKMRRISLVEDPEHPRTVVGTDACFVALDETTEETP